MVGSGCYLNYYWTYCIFDMEVKGTREAFFAMIQERGVYKKLGVDRSTVSGWKSYLKEGKSISLDKMEEMLVKSGAIVIQEKVWGVIKPK